MNQHIHCSVNNCHYWEQGNKCQANEIVVTSDSFGTSMPDRIDATQASTINATPAGSCMETCCKTFVEQGSKNINVDGVTKI
jgi:hypothetical protein